MQGKLLKHNLAAEVVDALKDLRDQLSQNEMRRWQVSQKAMSETKQNFKSMDVKF